MSIKRVILGACNYPPKVSNCAIIGAHYGGDLDSTTVTNPKVHAVMVANHVNPKLQTISCQ